MTAGNFFYNFFGTIIFLFLFLIMIYVVAIIQKKNLVSFMKGFFLHKSSGVNLAVFRIAVFFSILFLVPKKATWMTLLPNDFFRPPPGTSWFAQFLPLDSGTISVATFLFILFSVMAMVGFFSRTSAFFAFLLGLYVLGLPQFYGKVSHDTHHLIWFSALLAVSPCGDMFSLDAVIRAWRRPEGYRATLSSLSIKHGAPIRFAWALFGIIYFFPGLWKLTTYQTWIFGESVRQHTYLAWIFQDIARPFFRFDYYPILYRSIGAATILFELIFLFFIFFKPTRIFMAIFGIFFHLSIYVFMGINFLPLIACYVIFFDWEKIFKNIGKFIFKNKVYFLYDGKCRVCRKTIAIILSLDVLQQIVPIDLYDQESQKHHHLPFIDRNILLEELHCILKEKRFKGFYAYQVLAFRIPFFWCILPLLHVSYVEKAGKAIYNRVAKNRTCEIGLVDAGVINISPTRDYFPMQIFIVFLILFIPNIYAGVGDINSWPYSVYPTFHVSDDDFREDVMNIRVFDNDGKEIAIDLKPMKQKLGFVDVRWLERDLIFIRDKDAQQYYIKKYLEVLNTFNVVPKDVKIIEFSHDLIWIDPDKKSLNPVNRDTLLKVSL